MAVMYHPRDYLILTNNPLVSSCMEGRGLYTIRFQPERSFREILVEARDMVYAGHILYTHPLAGSVKPNETPYKTIFLTKSKKGMDAESLRIIEECVIACKKFGKDRFPNMPEQMRQDFRTIDCSLCDNAMASAVQL